MLTLICRTCCEMEGLQNGFFEPCICECRSGHPEVSELELSGKLHIDMRIPLLNIKITVESNPLKSRSLVRRLAVVIISGTRGNRKMGRQQKGHVQVT